MIKKVPLKELVSILIDVYDQGFDFVDIIGGIENDFDTITISVNNTYLSKEEEEDDDDDDEEINITPINKINLDDLSA